MRANVRGLCAQFVINSDYLLNSIDPLYSMRGCGISYMVFFTLALYRSGERVELVSTDIV